AVFYVSPLPDIACCWQMPGNGYGLLLCLGQHLLAGFDHVFDGSFQVESSFGIFIHFAVHNHVETTYGVFDVYHHAGNPGKLLCYVEWLGKEALHAACTLNDQFVFLGKFIHTQNGDDILKFLVTLQDFLYTLSAIVVVVPDYFRSQDPRSGVKRVNRRINTQLGDLTVQYRGRVQVGKGCCRSRVGQVVGRYVNRLYRGNGPPLGGGDPLLHLTHCGSQGRLVTYRRGHPSQQGRYLGTRLGKAENIIDKEQDVTTAAFFVSVAEILRYSQPRKRNPGTGAGRFVHLPEIQGGLSFKQFLFVSFAQIPAAGFHGFPEFGPVVDYARFNKLTEQVVPFAGPLAYARKYGKSAVAFGDVID